MRFGGEPRVVLEDVLLVYPGGQGNPALKGVGLKINAGEWVAVMGANGSGKSSLSRLVACLQTPTRGHLSLFGCPVESGLPPQARARIGYLSQHPEHHVVGLTVGEDLRLSLRALGVEDTEIERRIDYWLDVVGLRWAHGRRTDALSGGELQRVALAGILARRPELLVLDEPTAYADPATRRWLLQVLNDYRRETEATLLWVTHESEEASWADRVLVLSQGEVVYDGRPDALWERGSAVEAWGIGLPREHVALSEPCGGRNRSGAASRPGGPAASSHVSAERVAFEYAKGSRRVLRDVALELREGDRLALLGPSGAGKSSLLSLCSLLEQPTRGRLRILQKEVAVADGTRQSVRRFKDAARSVQPHVAIALQNPEAQLFGRTVYEDLTFGLRFFGVSEEEWEERVEHALYRVGLSSEVLERSPFELSGGQRRKVALAVCMVQQPDLYLFDEPTAGLDYPSRVQVAHTIAELTEEPGKAVIFATHDHELVLRAATRCATLKDGRLVEEGARAHTDSLQPAADAALGISVGADPRPAGIRGEGGLHRLLTGVRPEVQIVGAAGLALSIAAVVGWWGLAAAAVVVATLLWAAKAPLRSLLSVLLGLLPFIVISMWAPGPESPLVAATGAGFGRAARGLFVGTRMFLVIVSVWWLSRVLTASDLLLGIRRLLTPLSRLGLPMEVVTIGTMVGARMVPTLAEEARRIYNSQSMRGLSRVGGWRGTWLRVSTLAVPLFAAVLRRAEHMGEALLTRGYGERIHERRKPEPLRFRDVRALFGLLGIGALILLCDRWGG